MKGPFLPSLIGLLCCVAAGPAAAQTAGSDRPFRGIFGGRGEGTGAQRFDVIATLVQAYDDNLLAESGGVTVGTPALSGQYTMLTTGTEYAWTTRKVLFGVTGASAWRYYTQAGEVQSVSHSAGVGVSAELAPRTSIALNQSAAYSPSYLFGLFPDVSEPAPGDSQPTAHDYAVNDLASYTYATRASLSRGLTRRWSMDVGGEYLFTDVLSEASGRPDMRVFAAQGQLSRNVGRRTTVKGEYYYRAGEYGLTRDGRATEHGVRLGVDHTKVISASRVAQFSVGLGVATLGAPLYRTGAPAGSEPAEEPVSKAQFSGLSGIASVRYEFARGWEIASTYRRGVTHNPELAEPVFVDGATAALTGFLSRRVDLMLAAGYSNGESQLYTVSSFDTYTGVVRSRIAITHTVGLYLEYLYYFYDFTGSALLLPGQPARLERNGVRAGLTFFLPVFRR